MCFPASGRAAELCEAALRPAGSSAAKAKDDHRGQDANDKKDGARQGPKKWWIDPQLRSELGITDQQSADVELEWQKSLPKLREARAQLEKLEKALSQLLARDDGDEAAVAAQIDRVEAMRTKGNKTRTLMLFRMDRILTVEQRAKVKALMERRNERREGGRRGGDFPSR